MHSMIIKLECSWRACFIQIQVSKKKKNKEKACITNSSNPELHGSGTRGTQDRNMENVYVDFGGK